MKKLSITLLVVMVAMVAVSCASEPEPAPAPMAEPDKSGLPDFVLNPPMATDAIYGVGFAKQSTMALSIKVAGY